MGGQGEFEWLGHLANSDLGRAIAAALAAVLPKVVRQTAQGVVVGGVVVKRAFRVADEHLGIQQPFEVVAQRGRREVDVALNLTSRAAALAALHDEAQDRQTNRMTQRR